ncbi:MAG TPA: sugar ABC transporter permease [Bauldia sp.]|nr:sugar ABC transporter permease [Bauldia sp.]
MALAESFARAKSTYTRGGLTTVIIFLPPALVLFTVFIILPIAEAGWYAFFNWNGLGWPDKFIGLDNFSQLFANKVFTRALVNNGLIIAVSLLIQLPLALAMAVLVADRRFGAVTFRMIFFLPYILADVAAGLIWRYMFDGDYGIVSQLSSAIGTGPIYLLANKQFAFAAVLIVIVWKYFGFHMMLYIAGMQNIDKALYEAAAIDGANAWQRFRFVTLPGIAPMIRLSVFFSLVGSLQVFDVIRALTFDGGPLNTTHSIVSFLYIFGVTRMRVGFGSAVGIVIFILCVVIAFGYKRLFMRND